MKGNGALLSVLWVSPEDQAQMSAKSYSFKFKGCLALMRLRRGGTIRRELPAQGRYCASGIKTAWYTFCAPSEKRSWNLMKGGNPTLIPLCTVEERNAVMRNRVTWLKPREEFVAESEADPSSQLPGLGTEMMLLLVGCGRRCEQLFVNLVVPVCLFGPTRCHRACR